MHLSDFYWTHSVADEGLACAAVVFGGVTTGVVFGGTVGVGGAIVSNFSPGKVVKLYPSQGAF